MSKHRIRHENAFRAGGREMAREILDDLLALTPVEAHANLRAIFNRNTDRPKWQRIEKQEQAA